VAHFAGVLFVAPNRVVRKGGPTGVRKEIGRGERIRTSGLYVPNVALYQAKLHPVCQLAPRYRKSVAARKQLSRQL
jgi:hypothetical protein